MALFHRAAELIPGGIYGHATPVATIPGVLPYYADSGKGCRYTDIDGNTYIDYMCGYGPIILGHANEEVDAVTRERQAKGDCFNHPSPLMVELAERLVGLVDFADWSVFAKNGSDMTTWATMVARQHTGRKKVLKVAGAYHGTDAWCTPGHGGLIEEDLSQILNFKWNDSESIADLFAKHSDDIACVIITPFHHPAFGNSVLPDPEFLKTIRNLCTHHGALFIVDDIRAGFRLNIGGSHRYFGFEPDLVCFCKAMANGYPISSTLGRKEYKVAASNVFLTGSYWNNAVPMAASLKTLELVEKHDVPAHLEKMGQRLFDGLTREAKANGFEVVCSGPPAIPFMSFADDPGFHRMQKFSALIAKEGVYFHPHHNWFLCAEHREADIDETISGAGRAFAALKAEQ
ncbi:MAG: aminotransferase class III-fold pyridoxal phosphate-dependent enzyme [Verrucomicrobiota bacterium]